MRQLLAYERQGALDTYTQDLRYLLLDRKIRFHIRDLVLAWLATVENPLQAEWDLLAELMDTATQPVVRRVGATISGPAWFVFLDGKGVIERWLSDGATADLALGVIGAGQLAAPERAAELLAGYRERSLAAADDVAAVLQRSSLADNREMFELFIDLLDADDRNLNPGDFFYLAHDLPEKHPDWGCELIGAYLRNRLRAADAEGIVNLFYFCESLIPRQLYVHDLVDGSARGAPQPFVEHVLPQILAIVKRTAQPQYSDETEPVRDAVWHAAHIDRHRDGLDDHLLVGAEIAMRQLAVDDPQPFLEIVDKHRDTEYETVCTLLFEGFRANPEQMADMAADFVLADPRRLSVGRSSDDHWSTRQLLQAITPHCSTKRFARLEELVLGHFTPWEKSKEGRKARGYSQFTLLEGMTTDRLSDLGRRRLGEWQRKFNTLAPNEPLGVMGGVVGSPISSEATRKMTDRQWLQAFAHYDSTDSDHRDFLKGGAHQLSQELEACAKQDPVRFVGLAAQMPHDVHVYYFDALLRGVATSDQEVDLDTTRALIERCHALPSRPCGRWIAQPLRRQHDVPLSQGLVDILTWYAVNDPNPPEASDDFSGDISDQERVELQGLNSVRGSIAYEIAGHVHRHEDNVAPFSEAVESLVHDRSAAVRVMAIRTLTGLMRHRPHWAVGLFGELASHPDDRILASREAHKFLRFAGLRYFSRLRPVIECMVESETAAVRTSGAVQAALAALEDTAAQPLAERCLAGDPALRLGVARVTAANVRTAGYRARCEAELIGMFDDADAEVRKAATKVFRELADENFTNSENLVDEFLTSAGFDTDGAEALLHGLDLAPAPPPALSLRACSAFLNADFAVGDAVGGSMVFHDLGKLVVRAYADADDLAGQNAALDVIDRVLELDSFRVNPALTDYER